MIYLNIDETKVNTILTIVSIVLTAISIGCTISTVIMMFRTKKIKNDMMEKLNSYGLVSYIDRVQSLYLELSEQKLPIKWNEEIGENFKNLLSKIQVELRRINEYKDYVSESNYKQLKESSKEALRKIVSFSNDINEELSNQYHLHNFPYQLDSLLGDLNTIDEKLQSVRSEWIAK